MSVRLCALFVLAVVAVAGCTPTDPSPVDTRRTKEVFGVAPVNGRWTIAIDNVTAGHYQVLFEAYVADGAADCTAHLDPPFAPYPPKFLGRYDNDSIDATRSFRLMRLAEDGQIRVECQTVSGSPTRLDGMLALVPLAASE